MHQHPPTAPAVYQPQPLNTEHQALILPAPAPDTRRALVQLDTGQWVLATVPAAPPVLIPTAPQTSPPRRPLTAIERRAVVLVGSVCALTLSTGGALAMAGPAALAAAASLAAGAAVLLGTAAAAWAVLRFTGALSRPTTDTAAPSAPTAPSYVTHVTNNVTATGLFGRPSQTTNIHQG
ncbi:hypothetical protein [Streptomyces sp. NPDC059708]|uniref:hypothetical protein n=1 Tax=Streptomyces sp. NPDC059708 TaxID=3346916 RepID=UPI0036929BB9